MHILFLTWKDIRHPHAGGAEKVIYEYAHGLREKGHEVTWFASSYPGALVEENIDGIHIIRKYTNHTIWMGAWWWYRKFKCIYTIDAIIDEAGGWPLLSPLYEKSIPIYFLVHHIGDKEFNAYPFPLGKIAKWIYRKMISLYRNTPTITVSHSTGDELIRDFSFSRENIAVIENTTNIMPIDHIDSSMKRDDIVFLGRLTTIKRPDHAIEAFALALSDLPRESRLHIIGNKQDMKYVDSLHILCQKLGIYDRVVFHGFLPDEQYMSVLQGCRCMLVPSEKEGYGLIVIEANAYGIPVIAYDVPGLRDSVQMGRNGILVPDGDTKEMSENIIKIFANEDYSRILADNSLEYVRNIPTWTKQVQKFEKIIQSHSSYEFARLHHRPDQK